MTADLHAYRYGPARADPCRRPPRTDGARQAVADVGPRHLADVTVVAPDLLGHGRSSWDAPWTIDANVAAIAALLDADGGRPVVAVGHSFGGAIALNLAAARPISSTRSCSSIRRSAWMARACARSPTRCWRHPTTPTAKRPAPIRYPDPGGGPGGRVGSRARRAPDPLAARAVRLADEPARHDGVLERTRPPDYVAVQRTLRPRCCARRRPIRRSSSGGLSTACGPPRAGLHPRRRRLRSHGAVGAPDESAAAVRERLHRHDRGHRRRTSNWCVRWSR